MTTTLPMSRFIQNYKQHLTDAEVTGEVIRLEQRAGQPAWILQTESRAQAFAEATAFVTHALIAVAHDDRIVGRFAAGLLDGLPWVTFLPEPDRAAFASEAIETLRACVSVGRYTAFADLIDDWRNTAEIWSDPALAAALSGDIDELVEQPVDA